MSPYPEDSVQPPMAPPPVQPPPYVAAEPLNPWFSIWAMPRATMRQILDTNPRRMVHFLAILGAMAGTLRAHIPDLPFLHLTLGTILICKVVASIVLGFIFLYIISGLTWMTGRWLGGTGTFVNVRAAIAWANVPNIWGALLWLPMLSYLGTEALNLDPASLLGDPAGLMLLIPIGLMEFALFVWWVVVFMKCLGEAHRFSAWHAFGASLIAIIIFAIPMAILAGVVIGMVGLSALGGLGGLNV